MADDRLHATSFAPMRDEVLILPFRAFPEKGSIEALPTHRQDPNPAPIDPVAATP